MNTITTSWCKFTGWGAYCWEIFDDEPFFGGNGFVGKAWDSTYADDGSNITANTLQAFNYFEQRGVKKYFTRARPSLFVNGTPQIYVGINVDFEVRDTATALSFSGSIPGLWDSGTWDNALWGAGLSITNQWQGITGLGYCAALQLKSASTAIQIEWASTDIVFQSGWPGI